METSPAETNKIQIIKPIPQEASEQFGPTCSFCRQQALHPLPNQSDWSSKDWDGERAKAREQKSFTRFDTPRPTMENPTLDLVNSIPFHGLTICTDGPDKKAPEVPTATLNPPQAQEAGETTPKEGQQKLDPIAEEEEKQAEQEIRRNLEEAKYKLYVGQLSMEDSDLDTDMDESNCSFQD